MARKTLDVELTNAEKAKLIRETIDEKLEQIYADMSLQYNMTLRDVKLIHKKLIYKYI